MSLLFVHIVAGLSAVVSGVVALSVTKGGALHRTTGSAFVWSMVVMAASRGLNPRTPPSCI